MYWVRDDRARARKDGSSAALWGLEQKDGKALDSVLRKDTVIVPKKSSLKFTARFDERGTWVYHCHILEHAETGMMGTIQVE